MYIVYIGLRVLKIGLSQIEEKQVPTCLKEEIGSPKGPKVLGLHLLATKLACGKVW